MTYFIHVRIRNTVGADQTIVTEVVVRSVKAVEISSVSIDAELNRVLGGGLVQGSLVLIGGEPGIGKSTLVLQTVLRIPEKRILYVSGEESTRQLKL